jgi:hypothetical protein
MAEAVKALFTTTELDDYGNIILNGYATTGPNSAGTLGFAYADTGPAVALPQVTSYTPAMKGWTTNYMQYYTRNEGPTYNINPGDPTMFEYVVHSFVPPNGSITTLAPFNAGSGYTPGVYLAVPLLSATGTGATADITVDAAGEVTAVTINAAGTGYQQWQTVAVDNATQLGGTGTGFYAYISAITVLAGGAPQWARPPHRYNQFQVLPGSNNASINNPAAIQYSFMYPVADSPVAPPIDYVA